MRTPRLRFPRLVASAALFAVGMCACAQSLAAEVAAAPVEPPAAVHTQLEASVPADGDTLTQSPPQIRLEFNRAVDASLGEVRLLAADGSHITLGTEADPGDDRILLATPPGLGSGSYRVHWRIVADDGHPVTGEFAFVVELPPTSTESTAVGVGPADSAAAVAADSAAGDATDGVESEVEWETGRPDEVAAEPSRGMVGTLRTLGVGSLLALAGVLAFVAWWSPALVPRARRLGVVLAVLTPLLLIAHFIGWLGYIAPPGRGVDLALAGAALDTVTGRLELLRFVSVLLAALGLLRLRRVGLAAAFALLAVLLSGGTGHAADGPILLAAAKSAHLVAAAVWVGGLLLLLAAAPELPSYPALASRVSGLALASVILVALSGAWQTLDLLPSFGDLFGSGYGRMVLAKLGGLGVLMGFGAFHRLRIMPRLEAVASASGEPSPVANTPDAAIEPAVPGGQTAAVTDVAEEPAAGELATDVPEADAPETAARDLQRLVAREVVVMAVVLLLAGFLAYLPLPEMAIGASP